MSKRETTGLPEEFRVRSIIPVNSDRFEQWIKQIRSKLMFDEEVNKIYGPIVREAVEMAIAAIQPWATDAGLVVMASDPDAFIYDVMRKLVGIAETIKSIVQGDLSECAESLNEISRLYQNVGSSSELSVEMSKEDVVIMERIEKCNRALRKGREGILAFMIALDIILGAVQANLPASLMSNMIKGRSGFFTD